MSHNQRDKDRALVQAYLDDYAARQAEAERRKREKTMTYAVASVGLEGFKVPNEITAQMREYVEGRITFDQLRDVCLKW